MICLLPHESERERQHEAALVFLGPLDSLAARCCPSLTHDEPSMLALIKQDPARSLPASLSALIR